MRTGSKYSWVSGSCLFHFTPGSRICASAKSDYGLDTIKLLNPFILLVPKQDVATTDLCNALMDPEIGQSFLGFSKALMAFSHITSCG